MSRYAHGRRTRLSIVVAYLSVTTALLASSVAPCAAAQESPTALREAGKHFQRGVTLYGEADYRAALVEFKRAYATAPNVAVLYNVGEAEYQLQDYASALTTFERYLAEASPSESHRAEVEGTLDVLRARVGHLSIATSPPGAEITVDDQAAGKTPFEKAILVSIGRRKVVASMAGHTAVSRYVDVAADDNVAVSLQLPATETSGGAAFPPASSPARTDAAPSGGNGGTLRAVGWILTGASAAGAVTFGLLAMRSSSQLATARAAYPTSNATLAHDASLTTTYSIVADSLTVAAILVGGVTLYSTLASSSSSSSKRGSAAGSRLSLGPASARFEMTF